MKNREHRPDRHASALAASRPAPAIAPGKRTLTMGLASRAAADPGPPQRKAQGGAAIPTQPGGEPVEDWMRVAMRPDLYQTPVLRKSRSEVGYAGDDEHDAPVATTGRPMPAAVQAKMEGSLGADFSAVRIHEGPEATALGALAYTQGTQIHFAPGQYDPGSQAGQELLGHELTHVVQQAQGRVASTTQAKGPAIAEDPALEREADVMGAQAARGEPTALAGRSAPTRPTTVSPLQRKPVPIDGSTRNYQDDDKPELKLIHEGGYKGNQYRIKDMFQTLYWTDPSYYQEDTTNPDDVFDVDAFLKTKPFGSWMETYKEVSKTNHDLGMDKKELQNALSMHLLQQFISNALFNVEEIARQDYQASPLNFQDDNSYLRSFASSFTKVLQSQLPGDYPPGKLFLVRDIDFHDVLPQFFNVSRVTADPATDAVAAEDEIKTSLAGTIDKIASFTVANDGLDKYLDVPDNSIDLVDFTDILASLGTPDQIKDKAQEYGALVARVVYEQALPKIIDAYVDKHYALVTDKDALKEQLKKRCQTNDGDFAPFVAKLKGADSGLFDTHKDEKLRPAQEQIDLQGAPSLDDDEQLTRFGDELRPFAKWLKDNHCFKSGASKGKIRDRNPNISPHVAEKPALDEFLAARDADQRTRFAAVTRTPAGAFHAYLTGKKDELEAATTPESYLDEEFRALEKLLRVTKKGIPGVVVSGGMLTIDDRHDGYQQPALLVSDNTLNKAITAALNKSGYVPSPTHSNRKMLEQGVSLKTIVTEVIKKQQMKDKQKDRGSTHKKLQDILTEIEGFDPSSYTSIIDVTNQLQKTQESFTEFQQLGQSNVDYVKILAGTVSQLIEKLAILDDGSEFPGLAMAQLQANLDAAVANQNDIVAFVRNIQNLHEQIILALELDGEKAKTDFAFNVPKDDDHFRGAHVVDYGLRAFSIAYNAARAQHGGGEFNIDAYYNIYFELTQKLMSTQKSSTGSGSTGQVNVRAPKDIIDFMTRDLFVQVPNPNLVLIDIHPNDASRPEMHMQKVAELFDWLFKDNPDPDYSCTIVVDITLNHIAEEEVAELKQAADPYIQSGQLNLVFIQSLTKFAQTGADKHSGGLLFHYNDPDKWQQFNDSLAQQVDKSPADETTQKYFQALFEHTEQEQIAYLEKVRENNKYVYDRLKEEFGKLDIDESAISIAESDDPGTCYVAFHYQEFAARVFDTDVSFKNVHDLNIDILEHAINELMRKIGLPVSMRMSFGFPISNLGETGKEIRLTVGIEEQAMLDDYIKVLTYVNGKVSQKASTDIDTFKDGTTRKQFMTELVGDIDTISKLDLALQPLFKI